ncbi:MAG: hypothetical protein QOI20_3433, partial [Acidimicrobiaceae bacterium]|nr:hypothetical protein [Acidimicrobiaceae bacterium]
MIEYGLTDCNHGPSRTNITSMDTIITDRREHHHRVEGEEYEGRDELDREHERSMNTVSR